MSSSRSLELEARFIQQRWRDGDFVIGRVKLCNGSVKIAQEHGISEDELTIKGDAPADDLQSKQTYRFYGQFCTYRDERQFKFTHYVPAVAHDREGVVAYIEAAGRGLGVGAATAGKAFDKWGSDAVRIIRENPRELFTLDRRIRLSDEDLAALKAKLDSQAKTEHAQIEVTNLLSGRGFPKSLYRKTIKLWGNQAANRIRRDPYQLMHFRGCGFKMCDRLYLELGLRPDALRRQALCAWYAIASDTEGHTWYPIELAKSAVRRAIGAASEPDRAIELATRLARMSPDHYGALAIQRTNAAGQLDPNGTRFWVAEGRKAASERLLAELVVSAMDESSPRQITEYSKRERIEKTILDHARCRRCARELTAPEVHVWNGRPFGPTCIGYISDGTDVEVVPLRTWLEANPEISCIIEELPGRVIKLPEFSLWPEPDAIELIDAHQRGELSLALMGRIGILGGSPGTGKAQPLDAKVATPTGWRNIGDLVPGDYVYGPDGHSRLVKAVHPQGFKDVFRVTMSDGSYTECCDDHLWQVRSAYDKSCSASRVVPLSRIRQSLLRCAVRNGKPYKRPHYEVPVTNAVVYASQSVPVDPYILGVLLGDGSLGDDRVRFAGVDGEIIEQVSKRLPAGFTVKLVGKSKKDWAISKSGKRNSYITNPILDGLRQLGLVECKSWSKFVPSAYLYNSIECRIELLQGLLDTDGYCSKRRQNSCSVEFTTVSGRLATNVIEIVESLGGQARIRSKVPSYTHNGERKSGRLAWTLSIRLPESISPFKLTRKLERYSPATRNCARRLIKSVEHVGEKYCVCISVDAEDGLYLTDRFIVTHNTHTVVQLVKSLLKSGKLSPEDIAIGTPTGKSSVRVNQGLTAAKIPLRAKTWHSLLGVGEPDEETGGWSFQFNRRNPWPFKVIIGDEESMKDTAIMCSVLSARARGCHVLLVGDINQLPPVGSGAPLRDLIAAGLPYGQLTEIKRNSGGIVEACAAIRDGKSWTGGDNLVIVDAPSPEQQLDYVVTELGRLSAHCDPVWDAQTIVPVNKKSALSRKLVNERLQLELNANPAIAGSPFRLHDKVVCTSNGWYKSVDGFDHSQLDQAFTREIDESGEKVELYVANGELGRVLTVEEKRLTIEFFDPHREILVPRGKSDEKANASDDDADDKSSTGCNFELGYAISCHRMQGSEVPYSFLLIDEYQGAKNICSMEWMITGLSRAKTKCWVVGRKSTADGFCKRRALNKRKTFLRELILLFKAEKMLEQMR